MSYKNCGMSWDRASLRAYLAKLTPPAWCKGVTFHHTAEPDLAMRPKGWSAQLMRYVSEGYTNDRGWDRGPHFYPDDDEVWGLTPPTEKGIHAASFNSTHLGIEVLGNYDKHDDAKSGRGLACWKTAFWTAAEILKWLGLQPLSTTINFHRDDPKTTKSCPGTDISKEWVIAGVFAAMGGEAPARPDSASERIAISDWLAAQGKNLSIVRDSKGCVLVGGIWIESALYDKTTEKTTALVSELEKDLRNLR